MLRGAGLEHKQDHWLEGASMRKDLMGLIGTGQVGVPSRPDGTGGEAPNVSKSGPRAKWIKLRDQD